MLGWATVGMCLFYFAWRYNVLFVTDTQIDTRGLIYPRAIKQLFTGIYLAELCMIGLFGASVAPGPLVLMVVFLIFTALFHLSLNNALNPLLYNLPLSLLAEEEARHMGNKTGASVGQGGYNGVQQHNGAQAQAQAVDREKGVTEAQSMPGAASAASTGKKPNFFTKFMKPWIHSDYYNLRNLAPHEPVDVDAYSEEVEDAAYYPPSVTSTAPLLWIPRDSAGVSAQEISHTSKVIPITDEGCDLDEKGNIVWDRESTRPPVWEEKILY